MTRQARNFPLNEVTCDQIGEPAPCLSDRFEVYERMLFRHEFVQNVLVIVATAARSGFFLFLILLSLSALAVHIWVLGRGPADLSFNPDRLRVDKDNSVSEYFEYAMLGGTAASLVIASSIGRSRVLLLPAFLCCYLLIDNWFTVHERMGKILYSEHARAGEVIFAGLVAIVILVTGAIAFRKTRLFGREALCALAVPIAVFSFFAVGVDAVHSVVARYWPRYNLLFGGLEDFGEMLSIALLLAVAVQLVRLTRQANGPKFTV